MVQNKGVAWHVQQQLWLQHQGQFKASHVVEKPEAAM
jgi:predicted acetyltransferase